MSLRKILAPLALFAAVAAARGDVHPNIQSGFPVDQVFQVGEIDNVNLFNGALTLTIPVGRTYPVGGGFSYGLKLVYNANPWRFETITLNGTDYTEAVPSECSNAGLGWRVSLGMIDPPCQVADQNGELDPLLYQDETGTDHIFYETLHGGDPEDAPIAGVQKVLYTRDGSYLRMKVMTDGTKTIESPDGTIRTFGPLGGGRPTRIADRFENFLDITYGANSWTLADKHGRTHTITFRSDLFPYAQTVDKIELEAFGTTSDNQPNKAVYQFNYVHRTVGVACPNNFTGVDGSAIQKLVPLLVSVTLPDGSSYQMAETDYITAAGAANGNCTDHGGNLLKLTLPTLGKLAWTWRTYIFPTASSGKKHLQTSSGVATRQTLDANNNVLGTWSYTSALQSVGRELKVSVTDPLGFRTDRFYSTALDPGYTGWSEYDYSLPFTRNVTHTAGGVALNLSSQVWNGGALLRSEYVLYERDPAGGAAPPDSTNTNRRPIRSRTVFHDDGDRYAETVSSNFDGLGHYRTTTTGGNFEAGNDKTTTVSFNPARGTYVVNAGANTGSGYNVFPGNQPWITETYTSQQVTEGAQTATTLFCFDSSNGFLNRKRVLKNSGTTENANDLLEVYTQSGGNVATEQFFGGDKQALTANNTTCTMTLPGTIPYQLTHGYQGGVRATSEYAGMTFKSLKLAVDARTGLPSSSWDTPDVEDVRTDFKYDALGRLIWSQPKQGNNDGWTQYEYSRATAPGSLARVTIRKRANGSESAAVLAESEILFDAFGRVWRERQLLPGGIWNTRETLYDGAGNKASVSEAQTGNPTKKTQFLNYDAFGRPTTIRPADGSSHDVTFVYKGTRVVERTTKIGTTQSGGNVTESSSTTTERYDRQGRLYQVEEPSGTNGALVTTTYGYDVGNRLKSVSTPAAGTTQTRTFTYDNRGFLLSETHPEKGAAGNGTVTWSGYDARGHVGRKTDGPNDLEFSYDKAERLRQVKEFGTGGRLLKDLEYASANDGSDLRKGKLRMATRYNHIPGFPTVQVTETYVYGARQGRVSQRDTVVSTGESFTQTFAYTPLGQPNSVSYPECTHAACQSPAPDFADVSAAHPNRPEIEAMKARGITDGCATNPLRYCPDSAITRGQMAVFLVRAGSPPGYAPPACSGTPTFSDVSCSHLFAAWIEELYRRGVTNGCATNPLRYCPDATVTNAEMAIFLLRSKDGGSYVPPACPASPFNDVPCTHWAAAWIAEAKKRGIAVGDAFGNFSPGSFVTRAQMAGFLTRAFDFLVRIDPRTPRTVDLAYTNGLLTNVTGYGTLSYHPNLLVHQVTHGNGVVETWSNDPNSMRRPRSITATGPAGLDGAWSSGDYAYDGTGNITKIGNAWFTYDKVNRLTTGNLYTAPQGGGTATQQGYTYDPFGNLTAITGANGRTTPTTASTNRLTTGTYDAAGNLTNWNGATYQYDRFNQMVRMTSGGEDWAYVYTADDERIWSYNLAANVSTWTLRDLSGQVLREYTNENGTWTVGTDYIRRDGQLLAAETRLGRRHFHLDHLGTPRLITNPVGYQKAYHVYYPFGEEATAFDQDGERMKFTGHERDLASPAGAGDDLDYMHARHYSPIVVRFTSIDPAGGNLQIPQSWNRYLYVLGNPLKYVDPNGMEAVDSCSGASCTGTITVVSSSPNLDGFYEFLWASALFSSGMLDAYLSNNFFGLGRHSFSDPYFQAGQMVGDGASIISGLEEALAGGTAFTVGTGFDLTIGGVAVGVPVQAVGGFMIAHGATTSALGYINLMESNRKGGGKSGRKINEKREESLKGQIKEAELARSQAKTNAERDVWTKKIKHLRLQLAKSETHWRK